MEQADFKKWQVENYYRRSRWFWAIVFLSNTLIGFLFESAWGTIGGLVLSIGFFFLHGMLVGVHPGETSEEKWNVSSDKFLDQNH